MNEATRQAVERGKAVIQHYITLEGVIPDDSSGIAYIDIIADLLHAATEEDLNIPHLLCAAQNHHQCETNNLP